MQLFLEKNVSMLFSKASFPNYVFAPFPSLLPTHRGPKEPDSQSHNVPLTGNSCHEESPSTHLLLYKQEINLCELSDFRVATQHRKPYCNEAFGYMGTRTGITLQKREKGTDAGKPGHCGAISLSR